jgi:hypothetical protein
VAKRTFPRPDKDDVLDLLDTLDTRYAADLDAIEETRHLRERSWAVTVPEELETMTGATGLVYHDPTISEDLNHLPTLYTSQFPSLTLTADPRAGEKTVDDLTTRLEAHTSAALFEVCGCRSIGPPTHERLYQGVFSGAAWTMLVKRRDRWSDYDAVAAEGYQATRKDGSRKYANPEDYDRKSEEALKKAGIPIDWVYLDAATVRPHYEGDELVAALIVQERDVVTCLKQYRLGLNETGEIVPAATAVKDWTRRVEGGTTVRFVQYWDAEWMSYVLRYGSSSGGGGGSAYEIPGYTKRHRYGLGRPPVFGSLGLTKDYEFARLSTAHASEAKVDLVKYVSFGRTMLGYLAVRDAMPILYETLPPEGALALEGETGKPRGPEPYRMGTKLTGQLGATLQSLTLPDVAEKLAREVAQAEEHLRRMGPTEVTGSLQGAGEAMATAFERDRARVNAHEASIVRHLTEVTHALWTLEASFDEAIYAFPTRGKGAGGYVKVSADDFDTAVHATWTLHVDSMAADMIREQYASRRVENGTLSKDQSIEMQGSNLDEVHKGTLKDRLREGDTYLKAVEAEIQAYWGRDWLQAQQTAQKMAATAQGPQQPGPNQAQAPPGLAVPPGANGQTSAGVSLAPPPGGSVPPGVPPGTPAPPSVQTGAATAGVHGGAPGG